jgi:hypothetical protein
MKDWEILNYDEKEYLAYCEQQKKCLESKTLFYVGVPSHLHLSVAVCGYFKRNCAINLCPYKELTND